MVSMSNAMTPWSQELEDDLGSLLKDWLKSQGRTQADLRRSLRASSTRMPALLEVLERAYSLGGMPSVAARLCAIEAEWADGQPSDSFGDTVNAASDAADPFGQLDLLLQEIRDDRAS